MKCPSTGRFVNSGTGLPLQPLDIGHEDFVALVEPDTALWMLVKKEKLCDTLSDRELMSSFKDRIPDFKLEMQTLRFGLKPSAVYFNPTERCNLNCSYCYIPAAMRKDGEHMSQGKLIDALARLKEYFAKTVHGGRRPQVVFHGAEPMLARDAVFAGIKEFKDDFNFGVQTNATLLDDKAIDFLTSNGVGIGISLDSSVPEIANQTRMTWSGEGVYDQVISTMGKLKGYDSYSVIATITEKNVTHLSDIVDFLHGWEVPTCMLNVVRCTLPGARDVRAADDLSAKHFIAALDRTHELYRETGRKLTVANFANIVIGIIAPPARRLMCDISPCGGGRCFFALAPGGDMFPCSEFIGLPEFKGGNLFEDSIADVIKSPAFNKVTERKVEDIEPCNKCAIRHFCGSPCPAEAHEMNGSMKETGAFCEFYEEQVRYAFRLIADGKESDFLWDNWDKGTKTMFDIKAL